jgi:hypothetical protein
MKKISTLKFQVNTYHPDYINKLNFSSEISNEQLFKAPDHCIQTIMNFAKSYCVAESQTTGKVEMVLN